MARTDAERRRQEANRAARSAACSAAQATAQELVSGAGVNTAGILALEHEETPLTRSSLLLREYRTKVGEIMNQRRLRDSGGSARRRALHAAGEARKMSVDA